MARVPDATNGHLKTLVTFNYTNGGARSWLNPAFRPEWHLRWHYCIWWPRCSGTVIQMQTNGTLKTLVIYESATGMGPDARLRWDPIATSMGPIPAQDNWDSI